MAPDGNMIAHTEAPDAQEPVGGLAAWRRRIDRWGRTVVGGAAVVAVLAGWEVYGRSLESNLFIPTFSQVVGALVELAGTVEFWLAYRDTLVPFGWGWSLALVVGVPFGLLMGRSRVATGLTIPYMAFLNALPISTLVPVVVIAFGIGLSARATVVFLFAIVDVVLTTAAGVLYVDRELVEMARSFGMSRARRFRRVIFPGSMPGILAAIRVGTGRAVVGMVVMELLLVSVGVGRLISRFKDGFRSPELYAVVVSLAIFGLAALALVRRVELRALRWRPPQEG
jgi:ABC-type nitrate/sulfonate/bicarbonate transport system permease component